MNSAAIWVACVFSPFSSRNRFPASMPGSIEIRAYSWVGSLSPSEYSTLYSFGSPGAGALLTIALRFSARRSLSRKGNFFSRGSILWLASL